MFTLKARLDHLAIVSWRVRTERLAPMLPDPLVPWPIDAAGQWALVSMAMMLDTAAGSTYEQLNERAYVRRRDGKGEGAYFWRSHARSGQAAFFRFLLGIPEFHADLRLQADKRSFLFERDGREAARLELRPPQLRNPKYRNFDLQVAKEVSENPLIGYTLNWGRLCETIVEHDRIDAQEVTYISGDPTFMLPSVLIERDASGQPEEPLIAVYQRDTPFFIALPPRLVGGGSYLELWSRMFCPWSRPA